MVGAFGYAGQVCISVQRIFVHAAVWDEFVDQLRRRRAAVKMGDPARPHADVGRWSTRPPPRRTERWVREAEALGGRVLDWRPADGAFFPPTVLVDIPREAQVCSNEAFAPLVVVFPFGDFGAAISRGQRQLLRPPGRRLHQ